MRATSDAGKSKDVLAAGVDMQADVATRPRLRRSRRLEGVLRGRLLHACLLRRRLLQWRQRRVCKRLLHRKTRLLCVLLAPSLPSLAWRVATSSICNLPYTLAQARHKTQLMTLSLNEHPTEPGCAPRLVSHLEPDAEPGRKSSFELCVVILVSADCGDFYGDPELRPWLCPWTSR